MKNEKKRNKAKKNGKLRGEKKEMKTPEVSIKILEKREKNTTKLWIKNTKIGDWRGIN